MLRLNLAAALGSLRPFAAGNTKVCYAGYFVEKHLLIAVSKTDSIPLLSGGIWR